MNILLRSLGLMITVLALNVTTLECFIHCLVMDLSEPDHSNMKHVSMPASHSGDDMAQSEDPLDDGVCHHSGLMDSHLSLLDQEVRTLQASLIETLNDAGAELSKFYSLPQIREVAQPLLERPPEFISA